MNGYQTIDLMVVIIANLINLVLTVIFLNRVFGRAEWEHWLGYGTVVMILPLTVIAVMNALAGREWAFWLLPMVMVVFLLFELVLDYLLKFNFRKTAWLGPYLLSYYLALFAMIGYAFLAGKTQGMVTLVTYFINLAATFYSYKRVGHTGQWSHGGQQA
jgi:hypothetical protein